MTWLNVKGVKRVVAKGKVYYYHRRTMRRIWADPADTAAFSAEVDKIDRGAPAPAAPPDRPHTLGDLIALYRASPEFLTSIGAVSRANYQRGFDAVQASDTMRLMSIDQPWLIALRDKINETSGRWLANHAMRVLSIVFGWGVPRGFVKANPAKGVPKIRRRKGAPKQNKAWRPAELEAMLKAAREAGHDGVRKGVAAAYYAGLRKTDVVTMPAIADQGGHLLLDQSKTGTELTILQARRFRVILEEASPKAPDDVKVPTIVRRHDGRPYTVDGFDTIFHRLKADLVKAGKIRAGLTFHGLRTSLATKAADMGFSESDIAGALGQKNPASARPYVVEASRAAGARRVFKALEKKR